MRMLKTAKPGATEDARPRRGPAAVSRVVSVVGVGFLLTTGRIVQKHYQCPWPLSRKATKCQAFFSTLKRFNGTSRPSTGNGNRHHWPRNLMKRGDGGLKLDF